MWLLDHLNQTKLKILSYDVELLVCCRYLENNCLL